MAAPERGPGEDQLLRKLRVVSGVVILVLLAFLVVLDTAGKFIVGPQFAVSDVIFGGLLGSLLLVMGIEVASRIPGVGR